MRHPNLPIEGACRCGHVRIKVTAPPLCTFACHCVGCQKMSSSAFSLSAIVHDTAFDIIEGKPVPGGRDPAVGHMFCPKCMSWLYTKGPWLVGYVNLRPTMLDDTTWFVPFVETCVAEKLPFATTGATHSFAGFPSMDEFGSLLAEYAERAAG